ncbi:response regulator [Undibacterium jejuense]|uniref:Response regulator n=1 Tax=Undibacterium jejuense TaxID=1344949 RepID=A0A923KN47_9BURK|nr:response regulator [Undibacterium jejuense]MBC3861493.1 response regulator [Undibacterium jejuense]
MKSDLKLDPDAETMSTRDAAEVLKVSIRAVQMWVAQGRLHAWKTPGGHRRIFKSSVDAMCAARFPFVDAGETFDILVVDDQPLHTSLTDFYASMPGAPIKVLSIKNSLESLIRIGEAPPHLLITDVVMPHVDGFQFLATLSKHSWSETMRIIVTTRLSKQEMDDLGGLPSVIECYKKPVVLPQLLKAISKYVETWKMCRSRS